MNKRSGAKAALASAAIILAAAAPALATTTNVGGGTWSYDEGANTAWSNYKHPNNKHSSAVETGDSLTTSGCTAAGKWSLASRNKSGSRVAYYYNPSC
ncbi:lactococcin 972 family bacteriocin [Streptomyces sp. NPDC100445]|uniref:lactococcin 972 family bacteriocin n=1 Tax=Streptomyces sp. NPDC100445 TaxID=3366102 RepID=UPI003807CE22